MEDSGYNPRTEVRFAVVMYGGVSLAIYINGVVQELFRLVRATAPNAGRNGLAVKDGNLESTEPVYREIGRRRVGDTYWNSLDDTDLEKGVETRFVVDILSGTSAGGINGILLAKALANGLENIDVLKDLWIEEGDIAELLNEKAAYEGILPFKYTKPPKSLLAGDRLFAKARTAIEGMGERDEETAPHYADQVDLTVTMTDLQGLWLPLRLADGVVSEPRHRASLHFAYEDERNQFAGEYDRLLAFAARATSSFPVAFAPITLSDVAPDPTDSESRLFNDWIQVGADFDGFAFADGGYLYNKPFSHATEALRRRRADRPVTRKLLYVEPDPVVVPEDRDVAKERPDAIANSGLAMVGLPRAQPIRDDLEVLEERNETLARAEALTRSLKVELVRPADPSPLTSPSALVYLRLRRAAVVDDLTETVERAVSLLPKGAWSELARTFLRMHAGEADAGLPEYLSVLDLEFRFRRISYLESILDQLAEGGQTALKLFAAAELEPFRSGTAGRHINAAKARLGETRKELQDVAREIRLRGSRDSSVFEEAARLANVCHTYLETVTKSKEPDLEVAQVCLRGDVTEAVDGFAKAVARELGGALASADQPAVGSSSVDGETLPVLDELIARAHNRAEALDQAIYPLLWPSFGEARKVEVHRVSPRDAESLVAMPDLGPDGKPTGPLRLAGVSLGHFGGFLDSNWRRNDMLWGRLDGAERLIAVLVPNRDARDALRIGAHATILREEFQGSGRDELLSVIKKSGRAEFEKLLERESDDSELVACFASSYGGPKGLERARASRLAASSAKVGGKVLGGITGERPVLAPFSVLLRAIGGVATGALGLVDRVKRLFRRGPRARR